MLPSVLPTDSVVTVHDVQLHYRRWLAPTHDLDLSSILLLHGLASSSYIWNLVAPLLAERGYEVIALDQRGHGESSKVDTGYDFATIVEDDLNILQQFHLRRPLVVGHSWGAMVALELAASHRVDLSGIVLVDGALQQLSLLPDWTLERALMEMAPPRYAGITREQFLTFFERSPLAHMWTPAIEASVLHIVEQFADGTVAPRLTFEHHLQIVEAMWHQPTLQLYAQVLCPLKIVMAEQTPLNEKAEQRAALRQRSLQAILTTQPAAHIVRMPDTIHDIPLQRPQELAREILAMLPEQTQTCSTG